MEFRVGDTIEISHGKWIQRYKITAATFNGYTARRMIMPKSKADLGRFPDSISATNLSIAHTELKHPAI